jgi:hypothetical protein
VEVLKFSLPCGHNGYGIEVTRFDEESKAWDLIARIDDYVMHQVIGAIVDAAKYVDSLQTTELERWGGELAE